MLSLFSSRAQLCILMLCFWLFSNHKGRAFLLCCFLFNLQNNCKVLEWLQYPLQHECFLSSREMLMVSLGWLSDSLFVENSWFLFSFFFTEQLWLPVINLLGYSSKYAKLQVPTSFETVWGLNGLEWPMVVFCVSWNNLPCVQLFGLFVDLGFWLNMCLFT